MGQQISGLVAWYPCDNAPTDRSKYGNDATENSITYGAGKQFTNSIAFADAGEYFDCGNASIIQLGDTPQSIFAWVNLDSGPTDQGYIWSSRDGSNGELSILILNNTGIMRALIGTTSQADATNDNLFDDTWHHIGVVYDGSEIKYYVDGVQKGGDATPTGTWNTTVNKRIGTRAGSTTNSTTGLVGDVRVYNKALSEDEINQLYFYGDGIKTNFVSRLLHDSAVSGIDDQLVNGSAESEAFDDAQFDKSIHQVRMDYDCEIGDEVYIKDFNSNTFFAGYIKQINVDVKKEIVVYEFLSTYKDRILNQTWTNQKPEEIIEDIVDTYSPDFNFSFTSSITSPNNIPSYTAKNKRAWDVIKDMLDLMPNAILRSNTTKGILLEEISANTSSKTIVEGTNATNLTGWSEDTSLHCTRIKLKGATIEDQTEKLFSGTGAQTEFTLGDIPKQIRVEYDSGGGFTEQDLEIDGDGSGDYTVDPENRKITFNSAPASGSDNIRVTYAYDRTLSIEADADEADIEQYGEIEKEVVRPFIKTMTEMRAYAEEYLRKFSKPLLRATFSVQDMTLSNYIPGYNIDVTDGTRTVRGSTVSDYFVIRKVTRSLKQGSVPMVVEIGGVKNDILEYNKWQKERIDELYAKDDNINITQKYMRVESPVQLQATVTISRFQERSIPASAFYYDDGKEFDDSKNYDGGGSWSDI